LEIIERLGSIRGGLLLHEMMEKMADEGAVAAGLLAT
jgi:hypothetical protein